MKRWQKIGIAVVTLVLLIVFFALPLPAYIEEPGSAEPLRQFVTVDGKKDTQKGAYMLVTVGIRQATPFGWLTAHFNSFEDILSQQELMGSASDETYNQIQDYYMESSINNAIEQAYKLAKQPYQVKYLGIYVMNVIKQSSLAGVVKIGDTITAVDGHHFQSNQGFIDYLKDKGVGTKVKISYQHANQNQVATAKVIKLPQTKRHGIGITLTDRTTIKTETPVKINAGAIGGPSAGMMFSLQVYEQLTHGNLRNGRKIAGTGTIAADGTVGAIGGIDKKVVAANNAGATIFLAPNDPVTKAIKQADPNYVNNYHEALAAAKKIKTKMKIVPVRKFADVIDYLKTHQ
ncbi:SepM family pheromone-processing serine protease [Lapidilactobacillus bayanensis]|uniref:SepM family pheromone-processing serine protease n=1 Tax=Lapidilactobacillus bayanensis TaxID=2485998 RepID=UPI000F781597|nr:SepM family pheromone-processing serine protease [Lapidilactobacillus bayanensis]